MEYFTRVQGYALVLVIIAMTVFLCFFDHFKFAIP